MMVHSTSRMSFIVYLLLIVSVSFAKIVQLEFDENPPVIPDNFCDNPQKKWFDASVPYAGGKIKIKENLHYGKDVFKVANAQYMEDIRVYRRFFRDPKYMGNGFFVEIGGQNGVTFSNTLQFEYSMGWKGILIDASPVNYDRMRRQRPCTHNYWTAICPAGGQNHLYVHHSTGDSYVIPVDKPNQKLAMIPCRSMDSILSEHNVKWIDFFSLDVEGAELMVLQTIDFNKVSIGVLLIENFRGDREIIADLLRTKAGMVQANTTAWPGSVPDCTLERLGMKLRQMHIYISDIWVHPSLRDDICR